MHSIESRFLSRHSVGSESEANAAVRRDRQKEINGEVAEKPNVLHRKPAPKPPFNRKWKQERARVGSKNEKEKEQQSEVKARKSKQKGPIKRKESRGSREDELYPSKACFKAAIQSEASATQSEETDETAEEKEEEREQRSRMYSVESLL
jgi:hypothetical protein